VNDPRLLPGERREQERSIRPLFSVITFCRNGRKTIRRSIESVHNQTYPHVQHVVQDGASTDGTLDILRQYGSKLDLVSAPDGGTNDGFWRALLRCRGEFIAVCLADEELLPHALERAAEEFQAYPDAGAVTGDAYLCNEDGIVFGTHVGQEFDLVAYLLGDYCPNFAASFFRRSALFDVGFFDDRWKDGALDTVEFEMWCRLGIDHKVRYVPYLFAKYGMGADQQSHKVNRILGELDSRLMIVNRYLFGEANFFGDDIELKRFLIERQFEIVINHLTWNGRPEDAAVVARRMGVTLDHPDNLLIRRPYPPAGVMRAWRLLPAPVKRWIPNRYRLYVRQLAVQFLGQGEAPPPDPQAARPPSSASAASGPSPELVRAPMYNRVAERYRMRGQVEQAWQMWQHTHVLKDEQIASRAHQVLLKMPRLAESRHATLQRKWAETYASPEAAKTRVPFPFRLRKPGEKLTVAYHCVYLGADGSRSQVLPFVRNHDRSQFRVIGYSPYKEQQYVRDAFDKFRVTGSLRHAEFVDMARNEGVDIFVEMSGLSYRHRFAAMASRCALVQVHYMNHAGPICVPNVDYVLADPISAPAGIDAHYPERIYRMPGCLFGFDRAEGDLPSVSPAPHLANGHVTFGFFGGSEKLNAENLRLWADVLRAVKDARLLIQGVSRGSHQAFIEKQFRQFGVDPQRLTLLPRGPWQEILENYSLIDISLDSWPYCGANTIADSVYQGVPVLTLRGDKFASAYGASQVVACGLADLVASSPRELVSIAAALSADSKRLVALRRELRTMVREHGFGDSVSMARRLETAYRTMYAEALARVGNPPVVEQARFSG
jgi:predicted O-linked N-acetylglucosamine transferase (SPINDLY family)/glycosyltransferase involved in cell wall biosynthesis